MFDDYDYDYDWNEAYYDYDYDYDVVGEDPLPGYYQRLVRRSEDHEHDDEFQDHLITEVRGNESGWTLDMNGLCFHCPKVSDLGEPVDPPAAGTTARMYGKGFGNPVRGLYLNGQRVFYRTPEQEEQKHREDWRRWRAEQKREKLAAFEANREGMDHRFAVLPEIFQRRIQKFRDTNPEFRWEYEGYGNTFGFACVLARHYITNPENVYREHGALTPLVSCQEYGCPHQREQTLAEIVAEAGEAIADRIFGAK